MYHGPYTHVVRCAPATAWWRHWLRVLLGVGLWWLAVGCAHVTQPDGERAAVPASAPPSQTAMHPVLAYSLQEAEQRLHAAGRTADVMTLGGMTRLMGMIYDAVNHELIIVGQQRPGEPPLSLDDFVVALRALLVHRAWPLVSIDKTPETAHTGQQTVRFEGGIAQTQFGKDLLAGDVILKKVTLGLLPTGTVDLRSYVALAAETAKRQGIEEQISARFWFYPLDPALVVRDGVFVIEDLRVGVQTQVMHATVAGTPVRDLAAFRDHVGDQFAAALTGHYGALRAAYPEIGRLKALFDLVALAHGLQHLSPGPDLQFWLHDYHVPPVETPASYALLKHEERVHTPGGMRLLSLDGGIALQALLIRLQDGDITALKEAVLQAKPSGRPLTWPVPLASWQLPGATDTAVAAATPGLAAAHQHPGTSVTRHLRPVGPASSEQGAWLPPPGVSPAIGAPTVTLTERLSAPRLHDLLAPPVTPRALHATPPSPSLTTSPPPPVGSRERLATPSPSTISPGPRLPSNAFPGGRW